MIQLSNGASFQFSKLKRLKSKVNLRRKRGKAQKMEIKPAMMIKKTISQMRKIKPQIKKKKNRMIKLKKKR